VQVDIFTRAVTSEGVVYPSGSIMPVGLFNPGKEQQLRRNNIIRTVEFSDIEGLLAQAGGAVATLPENVVETVNAMVARAAADLDAVVAFRASMFAYFNVGDVQDASDGPEASEEGADERDDAEDAIERDEAQGDDDGDEPSETGETVAEAAVRKPLDEQSRSELEQTARSLGIVDPTHAVYPNKQILLEAVKAQLDGLPPEDAVSKVGQRFPFEA